MKDLNKNITPVLAVLVVVLVFVMLYALMFRENTNLENNLIVFILGALTGWVGQILSYFFGSSQGSKEKTELLNNKKDEKGKETV